MAVGVLALVGLSSERVAALRAAGYDVLEGNKYAAREEALRAGGDAVSGVLTNGRAGISAADMALLPNLEIICTVGAGYEAVDLDAARRRGIAVANSPDVNAPAVADSALMLLMAATRHLIQADRHVRAGRWQDEWRVETPTLSGKRLGILGLGRIGSRIAYRAARGFDMEVGYRNRSAVANSPYRFFDSLVDLAAWADFLIAATPGGPQTRHLIDADVLTALGPKGYVVNVGRGTVVETVALIDALRSRRIAGAGLDVIEGEPDVPAYLKELLQFDNVVITPHVAGRAPDTQSTATALILENLNAHFAGQPLRSPVPLTS